MSPCFLEGERKGKSPIELRLDTGKTYDLKLSKEGYQTKETKLVVDSPGAMARTVALTPVPQPTKPKPKPRPKPRVTPPTKLGGTSGKPGVLSVNSTPWSYVYLNGKKIGETPLINLSIASGKHRLKLRSSDSSLKPRETSIRIKSGKKTTCNCDFRKKVLNCR